MNMRLLILSLTYNGDLSIPTFLKTAQIKTWKAL